ncbi:protein Shroom2 isoform X2 [Eurytemora carolleeae]|uniref:protein Shroom2 isoform X2 n=1 Tax=Eurytemora carolleeae TaxID=1294199 RepID=UPI000C7948F2|nr:protein Shroom2 isoform X2 [Eurytemora carolleeae]|eukprot:XP_023340666.1 protein Shroom2-like isoform X2 [Eurytemora affinis]
MVSQCNKPPVLPPTPPLSPSLPPLSPSPPPLSPSPPPLPPKPANTDLIFDLEKVRLGKWKRMQTEEQQRLRGLSRSPTPPCRPPKPLILKIGDNISLSADFQDLTVIPDNFKNDKGNFNPKTSFQLRCGCRTSTRPLWIPDSVKPNQDIKILDQEKKKIKTGVDVRKVKTGVDVRKIKTGVDVKKIDQTVTGSSRRLQIDDENNKVPSADLSNINFNNIHPDLESLKEEKIGVNDKNIENESERLKRLSFASSSSSLDLSTTSSITIQGSSNETLFDVFQDNSQAHLQETKLEEINPASKINLSTPLRLKCSNKNTESSSNCRNKNKKKKELLAAIWRRVDFWRCRKLEIDREIKENEEIRQDIEYKLQGLARTSESIKFCSLVQDIDRITKLMLILSGCLARLENNLYYCVEADISIISRKKEKILQQIEDARHLESFVERRASEVCQLVEKYLQSADIVKYRRFLSNKTRLIVEGRETEERVRLALQQINIIQGQSQMNLRDEMNYRLQSFTKF